MRALGVLVKIPNAFEINRAYGNNTPETMAGAYIEVGYNFFHRTKKDSHKNFTLFARQELMDLNYKIPSNGIKNEVNQKSFTVIGLTYQPASGVVIKTDYVFRKTGDRNEELIVTPFPQALPYYTSNGFFNIGFGYSF